MLLSNSLEIIIVWFILGQVSLNIIVTHVDLPVSKSKSELFDHWMRRNLINRRRQILDLHLKLVGRCGVRIVCKDFEFVSASTSGKDEVTVIREFSGENISGFIILILVKFPSMYFLLLRKAKCLHLFLISITASHDHVIIDIQGITADEWASEGCHWSIYSKVIDLDGSVPTTGHEHIFV